MPFLLLLFLTLALFSDEWPKPWEGAEPVRCAALTWLGVALIIAFARVISVSVVRWLAAYPGHRERVLRRYGQFRTYHLIFLLGAYAGSLFGLGWGWTVQQICGQGAAEVPGAELLLLAPFLAALVLSWVCFYDAERALHRAADQHEADPFWSRSAYVSFHVRQNLALVFAPVLLLVLMKNLRRVFPSSEEWPTIAGPVLMLSVFILLPWLLRLVLGLKPLPPGPLRTRLETTARRLNFRCSNILVWNTRGGVANAMVAGLVPWVRYVLLTDRLMSELTPDEVDAVFGHEIGHVKHHHMLYYLCFLLVSSLLVGWLCLWLASYLPFLQPVEKTPFGAVPLVFVLGTYIFVVFGFLSRRCERQADVYGCRAVSCTDSACTVHEPGVVLAPRGQGLCPTGIRTFIEALEHVAQLNGISRDRPGWLSSWQHSTIARRVEFLQNVLRDPALERRFQRRVALVKWGLFLGLLTALGSGLTYEALKPEKPKTDGVPAGTQVELTKPHTAGRTAPSE